MPKIIRIAGLEEIREHERVTQANVRIGGYHMDQICPMSEFQFFFLELAASDLPRIFLLWEPTFISHTKDCTCKLVDIADTAETMAMERRPHWEVNNVDLTNSSSLAPVLVTNDLESGPLVTIDGNHRLTAHFARNRTIQGTKVFLAVHPDILPWSFIPPEARCMTAAKSLPDRANSKSFS